MSKVAKQIVIPPQSQLLGGAGFLASLQPLLVEAIQLHQYQVGHVNAVIVIEVIEL